MEFLDRGPDRDLGRGGFKMPASAAFI